MLFHATDDIDYDNGEVAERQTETSEEWLLTQDVFLREAVGVFQIESEE